MNSFRDLLAGLLTCCIALSFSADAGGQPEITASDHLISGYGKTISGDDFSYHSSVPSITEGLIVRATDGNHILEWETGEIPEKLNGKYATFVWLAGMGSSSVKNAEMDLSVDGELKFSILMDRRREVEMSHADGSQLYFHTEYTDQFGDHFGYMFLRVPAKQLKGIKHLRLRMRGGNFELPTCWYMTFKEAIKPGMEIFAYPAIKDFEGRKMQQLGCGVVYFGPAREAKVYVDNRLLEKKRLHFGYNHLRIGIPEVMQPEQHQIRIEAGHFSDVVDYLQKPVRKMHVNFVQHSHTDIGYTRPQSDILAEHMRFIDYALDYCDQTDHYPDEARFRWTCETTWAVNEYLKSRPKEQIERFYQRIREGRIEIAGMYLNFDELPDEQSLAASLAPLEKLREAGLPVKTAMQNDVNGIAWCMNDYYQDVGVKYLNMGTHGHRALICFDKPTIFWWESPSGKRMLTFRAEHYMTGNFLNLVSGEVTWFETGILEYLAELQAKGYPYDKISIQFSGYRTDNSPPSTAACEMIKHWNELYDWPKIRTATATEFFEDMESRYSEEFPVIRGAWPDWWTDGFGASAREVATVRKAQADLIANTGGLAMAVAVGNPIPDDVHQRISLANNALLFYTEHTVGYHGSVREPYHQETMEQRAMKESYSWEALRRSGMIREEALGSLQQSVSKEAEPSLVVYNTLNWERDGLLRLFIDHQIVPRGRSFVLVDRAGNEFQAQADSHIGGGSWWFIWIEDVPAFGYKKYGIRTIDPAENKSFAEGSEFENQWYRIEFNERIGTVSSLQDKELGLELLDQEAKWDLGQFIYERLGNRRQMELFRLEDYTRSPLDTAWIETTSQGPIWDAVRFKGRTEASIEGHDMEIEVRLFKPSKRIDMVYSIVKKPVIEPEGIYVAFPFHLEGGKLFFDVPGGTMEAGVDQIPGSANDWNTVQNFATLRNDRAQVILVSPEMPLMQFGGINTGRYSAGATPEDTHIYSWPMNNYWTTNFNAYQTGTHVWTYTLTSGSDLSVNSADRFGWSSRIPFLTRILPGGGPGDVSWEGSYIQAWPENILLVNARPAPEKNAILLQIREINGTTSILNLNGPGGTRLHVTETDVLGYQKQDGSSIIKPLESKFYKVTW